MSRALTPAVPVGTSRTDAGRRVAVRGARLAATLAVWAAFGAAGGLLLAVTVPRFAGFEVLMVLSGSMSPALETGDVVVDSRTAPSEARIGDVVTFRDPEQPARLITHRVRAMRAGPETVTFVTKGDANNTVETWDVATEGTIGRVEYRVPRLGYAIAWVKGRSGRLLLVVLPALLLGLFELKRIWFPKVEGDRREGR